MTTHTGGQEHDPERRARDLLGAVDWSATALGAPSEWPQSLRTAVDLMMASGHAMCLAWGQDRVFLYNDAYVPILGKRHPRAFGMTFEEVWPDIWDEIEPLVARTFAGETVTFQNMPLVMRRNGYPEDTWWTFSYSPVRDEAGVVSGLLNVTLETTGRVQAERQRDEAIADLRVNEAKWRHLFETLEEGFILGKVIRDEAGRIVDWRYQEVNNAWYDLVGIERGCAVGRTIREVFPGIEDEWVLEFARVVDAGEAIRFTRRVGDLQRWYDGVCQPAGDDQFVVLFLEVTDRVRAQQRREALGEIGRIQSLLTSPDEMSAVAAAVIGRALDVGRVGYGSVAEDGETFTVPNDWTAPGYPSLAGVYRMDDCGGYASDLREGRAVVIPDILLDPRTASNTVPFDRVAVRSLINLPVVESGRTAAVLYIHDKAPREWSPEEVAFVADAASRTRTAVERRRAEEELRESEGFLRSVLASSTDCIKVLDLDGKLRFMSEGGMQVMEIGDFRDVEGCPWPELLGSAGGDNARAAIEAARQGRTTHFECAADTFGGKSKWWSISVSPVLGADGQVTSILSVSRDHTERKASRERQSLLNEELSHRLKNTLGVVQAIALQTLGSGADESAISSFSDRLRALSHAHDSLVKNSWSSAKLRGVTQRVLASFDGGARFDLTGPDVMLGSRTTLSLSLLLHELATNATKYGALSVPQGRVAVDWSVEEDAAGPTLVVRWKERGGPPATKPKRRGFGSRLINMGLTGSGGTDISYCEDGVTAVFKAPLDHVQQA